jgi:hypothetical protein
MYLRARRVAAVVVALALAGCANPLGRQYEYEEQLYLGVNGSATVIVDSSVPALVALRQVALDPEPNAQADREEIRRTLASSGCGDVRVGQPWRRKGRRFVQVRISADDARTLSSCALLTWSKYTFDTEPDGTIVFSQSVGAAAGGDPGHVNWTGDELVAFKLHLPSRIIEHNVKRLSDGENGTVERGNILTWEQRLVDRRAGKPIEMRVRIESESILYRTLWLFAGAFGAAILALAAAVWLTMRRGRRRARSSASG